MYMIKFISTGCDYMTLYTCKIFDSVVLHGSFVKASKALNLTPSAISHTISALEDEMGFSLFIRTRNGVSLTRNGERLLPSIRRMLQDEESLKQEAGQIRGVSNGTVRIGSYNSTTIRWLTKIIKSFRQKYPDIDIQVYESGYDDIKYWVETSVVDIAFVTKDLIPNKDVLLLHKDMLVCVTPNDFIPENKTYITIAEIKKMPIIMQAQGSDRDTKEFLRKYNIPVQSSFHICANTSITAMVESGLGISIMPGMLFEEKPKNVNIYPIDPPEYRILGLVCSHPEVISPAAKKMREEILSFMQEYDLINL